MKLLELGVRVVAGYSVFSLLLGLSVVHREFERQANFPGSVPLKSASFSIDPGKLDTEISPAVHQNESSPLEKNLEDAVSSVAESGTPETHLRRPIDADKTEPITAGKASDRANRTNVAPPYVSSRFFPTYGTKEFLHTCGWTSYKPKHPLNNCTFLARPTPDTNEGISHWLGSQIPGGYLFSIQTGCSFYFDYGPGIDISQVFTPHSSVPFNTTNVQPINWTVPQGFDCNETYPTTCFLPRPTYGGKKHLDKIQHALNNSDLAQVPDYRFAYKYSRATFLKFGAFTELQQVLAGLKLETAMACSLASLIRLAPSAVQYEPRLYSEILPTLQQDDALVLALYIRTGFTDKQANEEKDGKVAQESTLTATRYADKVISCAVGLEQEYLANSTLYARIVWMVVSDSQQVKQYVSETYDTRHNVNTTTMLPRQVVTTSSRGVHSRASRDPSTRDFAEAFIDWYLIGESHAVIADQLMSPSFGDTAALRTARPLYKVTSGNPPVCQRRAKLFDAVTKTAARITKNQTKPK